MTRVHIGLPSRPLPMDIPVQPRQTGQTGQTGSSATASSGSVQTPQAVPQPQQTPDRRGDVAERILLEVLNGILGGN